MKFSHFTQVLTLSMILTGAAHANKGAKEFAEAFLHVRPLQSIYAMGSKDFFKFYSFFKDRLVDIRPGEMGNPQLFYKNGNIGSYDFDNLGQIEFQGLRSTYIEERSLGVNVPNSISSQYFTLSYSAYKKELKLDIDLIWDVLDSSRGDMKKIWDESNIYSRRDKRVLSSASIELESADVAHAEINQIDYDQFEVLVVTDPGQNQQLVGNKYQITRVDKEKIRLKKISREFLPRRAFGRDLPQTKTLKESNSSDLID